MSILPILSALKRHKTIAALILLEIALCCAVLCNAVFLIGDRVGRMQRASGLAENDIVRIQLAGIDDDDNPAALTRNDLAALRALPDVEAATSTNQIPFAGSSWSSGVQTRPDQAQETLNATNYLGDEQMMDTLGLHLVAGRGFLPDEYLDWDALNADKAVMPAAIITQSMAGKLFPGENPVGKSFYSQSDEPTRVVGIVDHLARPNDKGGAEAYDYSILYPVRVPFTEGKGYLVRVTDPARRAEVLKAAVEALDRIRPDRIVVSQTTLEEMRDKYYRRDRSMVWRLALVCVVLVMVAAFGIVGLTSFWVRQRIRQIGIRRALGATRGEILRHFQLENFLLTTPGIVLGMILAYGLNGWLMRLYELPRLPLAYLPAGAVTLWLLGQLAVLGPARYAASVQPMLATRSI